MRPAYWGSAFASANPPQFLPPHSENRPPPTKQLLQGTRARKRCIWFGSLFSLLLIGWFSLQHHGFILTRLQDQKFATSGQKVRYLGSARPRANAKIARRNALDPKLAALIGCGDLCRFRAFRRYEINLCAGRRVLLKHHLSYN